MELFNAVIAIVGMVATFIVSLALFVWWVSNKFFGIKILIDNGFYNIKEKMNDMHVVNIGRFHELETRMALQERKQGNGVHPSK
jgi:hypothetical protein